MPNVTVRPINLVQTAGWAFTGTGTAADLADNSDATFAQDQAISLNYVLEMLMAYVSIPATAVTKSLSITARMHAVVQESAYQVQAVTGSTVLFTDRYGAVAGLGAYQSVSQAVTLTAAQLADMRVRLSQTVVSLSIGVPTPVVTNVYEVQMDVAYATAPLVGITAPTGTVTTTSEPQIVWGYTAGIDGGGQTAYQVKIFSAAQYGAGGFNPDNSASTYDSGVLYGSNFQLTPTALVNGTYRAYVKAAQTINGQLHWSAWFGSGFVQNVTPPAAPTITATGDNTNARIKLVIAGAGVTNSVAELYEVQRSTDGGVTWVPVRGDQGRYVTGVGGGHTWWDYESDNGDSVIYQARTISTDNNGLTYIGAWGTSSVALWTSTSTWLKVPNNPSLNRKIIVALFGDDKYNVPQGVGQGLGSQYATVQTGTRRSLADGTLALLVSTDVERQALQAMFETQNLLLLQPPAKIQSWAGRYIAPGTMTAARTYTTVGWTPVRQLQFTYTQVVEPSVDALPLLISGTTWAEVLATYATWATIPNTSTWADLRS